MPELLYEQEGGKMKPQDSKSGGGPKIGTNNIDMKIQLVDDKTTLPSYLIPNLTCDDTTTNITGSKVKVTLTGDSLHKETSDPKDFKCEITSNFLTKDEKSAITIETYYPGATSSDPVKINKIYFDESLLSYYNDKKELKKSDNPFLANATTSDSGVTYTFEFDFNDIINAIEILPSYGQIQDMFMFVNSIPRTGVNKKTLIQISADGFLNLKFSGVPFISLLTTDSKLKLDIATTNNPIPASCELKKLFGSDILTGHLHKVLELLEYKDFDFATMAKKPVLQSVTPPVVDPAAAAAAKTAAVDLATAEAAHKVATAAAAAAKVEAEKAKTNAKSVIDGIKSKMDAMTDQSKIPDVVKTFINASHALAAAKDSGVKSAIATAEAAFKTASTASGLKEAIDEGLADSSTLPEDVKPLLTDAKTIQEQHDKMDAADAEVVKSKAVVDATRDEAAKAWEADQKAKLNTRTGTEAAAGSAIKVVNTNNTQAASTTSTELENKLKESIAAQSKKLDDVIAQLEALQKSQTNTGSTSVAGFGNVIVRAPGDSDACGNGGISMESRDGSLIFKVPYDKIISEIAPNMRSAMAQRALAKKELVPNAADPNATKPVITIPVSAADPNAAKPVITIPVSADPNAAAAGAALNPVVVAAAAATSATLDPTETAALQTAKNGLAAQQSRLTTAGIATMSQAITDLETAIKTAEAAVAALASAADDSAKVAALNNAKTKIALLAALVTAATAAVDAAIAAKIAELTTKLQKEATDVLNAAKGAYGAIVTKPNSPIDFAAEEKLITTASEEITTATNAADAAGKAAAIATATSSVEAAIAAAKAAKTAVDTAAKTPPATKVTGLSVEKLKEFDDAKASLKAEEAKLKTAKDELDAIKPDPANLADLNKLHQTATDAIALATKALDEVDALVLKINTLPDDAVKVAAVTAAGTQIDKAVSLVKTAVDAVKTAVDAINLAKLLTYQTYETTYTAYEAKKGEYDAAAKKVNDISSQAGGGTPAEQITAAKLVLDQAVKAIQTTIPVNINKLSSEDFDKLKDNNEKQEKITELTETTELYTKAIESIKTASDTYTSTKAIVIAAAKEKLDKLISDNDAIKRDIVAERLKLEGSGVKPEGRKLIEIEERIKAFELTLSENELAINTAQEEYDEVNKNESQGGGSKQSKSSSSKHKSAPKSKSKTKKNHHSKSKSNKNKTPKIIMNE